jgi:hypothetical protein
MDRPSFGMQLDICVFNFAFTFIEAPFTFTWNREFLPLNLTSYESQFFFLLVK